MKYGSVVSTTSAWPGAILTSRFLSSSREVGPFLEGLCQCFERKSPTWHDRCEVNPQKQAEVSADPGDTDGVQLMHKVGGRGRVAKVICVDQEAVQAHLNHGDVEIGSGCTVDAD